MITEKMKTVTVKKDQLLAKLKDNRSKHLELYTKAEDGYRKTVIEELNKQLDLAKSAKPVTQHIVFDPPEDHRKEYDVVIEMLEWNVSDEIQIDYREFECYVMDRWPWFDSAFLKNSTYLNVR